MLARLGETWVITRRDYRDSIEAVLQDVPERENLRFLYVEMPDRFRSWQRDLRGLRVYYLLWQIAALNEARRIRRIVRFDVVWHLTWATAWYGSLAALAGRPFVYGPVGGCVGTVWRLLPELGWRGSVYEASRVAAHTLARWLNPLARLSWNRAALILAQNPETRDWFPRRHRAKTRVFPNAVIREELTNVVERQQHSGPPVALFAGRLEPFKGVSLCLRALTFLPGWRLIICGSGSDERRLKRLARRLQVDERVDWKGWLPQDQVFRLMVDADVFMFPCLHEEAGAVVAEARAAGMAIVSLPRGGPPLLAGQTGMVVEATGGVAAISRRLACAAVMSLERRRGRLPVDDDPQALSLGRQAEALRGLVAESLGLATDVTGARSSG
jgi:glycosyltransferase involved in cell wall biosynthesis